MKKYKKDQRKMELWKKFMFDIQEELKKLPASREFISCMMQRCIIYVGKAISLQTGKVSIFRQAIMKAEAR